MWTGNPYSYNSISWVSIITATAPWIADPYTVATTPFVGVAAIWILFIL